METRMLYLHARSPIHTGTGQSTDVIDLPVAREAVYGWPLIPGSSLKGVLRDACAPADDKDRPLFEAAFGPDTRRADEGAGALWFADAKLLCFPVRSYYGTYALVTCPLALRRWQRDHMAGGLSLDLAIPASVDEGAVLVASPDAAIVNGGNVVFEDLDLTARYDADAEAIAKRIAEGVFADAVWQKSLVLRFGIVSDDVFTFLTETATEVTARIKLDPNAKTVQRGALWYEEAVPSEAIFAGPLIAAPRGDVKAEQIWNVITPSLTQLLQIGGHASVGRGLTALRLVGGKGK